MCKYPFERYLKYTKDTDRDATKAALMICSAADPMGNEYSFESISE
jgi:hypothetical protein